MNTRATTILTAAIPFAFAGCAPAMSHSNTAANSTAIIHWVRYTDSAEGAFSMDVPVSWQVQGGMYRFGYFDVRWMMEVRSLDGKTIIRVDDPNVPPYALPGPHTGAAGQPAFKPHMYQMMVDNYREARAYAETYAKHRFSSVCKSFTARPSDWSPTMPPAWRTDPGSKVTEATLTYDCATSDGPRVVTVYARTTLFPNSGLWVVDPIISIIVSPGQNTLARSMTQHMIGSWQKNPQWAQYQQQVTNMGLAQMRASFGQFLKQMQAQQQQREAAMNQQVSHFEAWQNAQAKQVSEWGDILTGVTNVADPVTGTKFQVFSGPKANYYTNGIGQTVNSNFSPGPDFHQDNDMGP